MSSSTSFEDSRTHYSDDDSNVTNDDSPCKNSQYVSESSAHSEVPNVFSDDDSPIAFRRKQKKPNIVISEDNDTDGGSPISSAGQSSSSNAMISDDEDSYQSNCSTRNDDLSNVKYHKENTQHASVISGDEGNDQTNKTHTTTASTSTISKNLRSFVDTNLFADDSEQNITDSKSQTGKKSKNSSRRSFTKSFTKYRGSNVSMSSDSDEENAKSERKENVSSIRESKIISSDSEEVEMNDSEDNKFEAEFQRNVYSPRTRMSITGVINESDLSDESDGEVSTQPIISEIEPVETIVIPESDCEEDIKPLKMSDLKNPLQSSSPLPTSKYVLQPKITNLAKVFVSQECFDKEVMKLNDMENELQKSIQLRGAFQVKLPDDGRRLSGRIDRLKLDIERQQNYIQTLEIQTNINQNIIKPIPKPAPPKIELSWDALDAATNAVKPKYTGTVGLSNFNAQKAMTLDTLKEIHESISACPPPDTIADDPKGLKIELMPHQKYALLWLQWRETQRPRGGILADDMGLGKTLTIIAHVLAANYRKENYSDDDSDENEHPHDGWSAKGRKDQYSGGTLVVCPASLIGQWESEIKNRVKRDLLSHVIHHGIKRDVKARHLAKFDVVITTYNIVARECGKNGSGPLANIKWERVVLDEAHVIRNHKTLMSESVKSLSRRCSWILTGTPVQNKEMDMYALFRFLKCRPFDDMAQFKKWIDNKNAGGQLRMNTILKAILLRRTKVELMASGGLLAMPDKTVQIIPVSLEREEMNVYQKIMLYSQTLFAQYLHQRIDKDVYDYQKPKANSAIEKAHKLLVQMHAGARDVKTHEILVLLLRLRQICCHPGLITAMLEDEDKSSVCEDSISEHDSLDIDLMDQLNKLKVTETDAESASFELPANDSRMAKASQKVLLKSNPVYDLTRPSSKFLKVLDILKTHILPKNENAVIVSQWTNVLEIVGMMLRREKISCSSLTGSVPVKDRAAIVENFNKVSQYSKILLLSLTAGGIGLNLVGGNHLLLIDLHWNPQLEAQAQDRVYRVGQTKPVTIYKLVCSNTIEERIKKLQERKLEIANGVLTGSSTKGSKLSLDDLKSLFEL